MTPTGNSSRARRPPPPEGVGLSPPTRAGSCPCGTDGLQRLWRHAHSDGLVQRHNTKLNCLEYHRDSEFNLGHGGLHSPAVPGMEDIDRRPLDTGKVKAFKVPAGVLVEVYATTLHYAPCPAAKGAFRVLVALPQGTNGPDRPFRSSTREDAYALRLQQMASGPS